MIIQLTKRTPEQYNIKLQQYNSTLKYASDECIIKLNEINKDTSHKWANQVERVNSLLDDLEEYADKFINLVNGVNTVYNQAFPD